MAGIEDRRQLWAYQGWQRDRNLAPTTIAAYAKLHRAFLAHLDRQDKGLRDATRHDVATFLAERRCGPRGRYHYLSRLSSLYAWLVEEGHAEANPLARIPRPLLPEGVPRPIATADLELAIRTAGPRTRAFFTVAAFAGLRCKEIAGLQVGDLLNTQQPPVLVVTSPKGKRERVVPLHPLVMSALRTFGLPRHGFVFAYWNDPYRSIQPYTVSHEGNVHLHSLGIAETMHNLRAWFATETYRQCRDIRMVQQLLGHRSSATTALYTAVVAAEASEVVGRLSLNSRRTTDAKEAPAEAGTNGEDSCS